IECGRCHRSKARHGDTTTRHFYPAQRSHGPVRTCCRVALSSTPTACPGRVASKSRQKEIKAPPSYEIGHRNFVYCLSLESRHRLPLQLCSSFRCAKYGHLSYTLTCRWSSWFTSPCNVRHCRH